MGSAEMGIATVPSEAGAASEPLAAELSAWLPEAGEAAELWDGAVLVDGVPDELHPATEASIAVHITTDRDFFIVLFITLCFPPLKIFC